VRRADLGQRHALHGTPQRVADRPAEQASEHPIALRIRHARHATDICEAAMSISGIGLIFAGLE
jgi:hypothetical protein